MTKLFFSSFLFGFSPLVFCETSTQKNWCDLPLHLIRFGESAIPGVGVYSGRPFALDETIMSTPLIPVLYEKIAGTALEDFYEGYNDTFHGVSFGSSSVFNHNSEAEDHMAYKTGTDPIFKSIHDDSDIHGEKHVTYRNFEAGEQIFISYGDMWFDRRPYDPASPRAVGGDYLKLADPFNAASRVPGCPSLTTEV